MYVVGARAVLSRARVKYCSLLFNSWDSIRGQSSGTHIPGWWDETNVRGREICHRQDGKNAEAWVMHWAFGNMREQRTETKNTTMGSTRTCLTNMWSRLVWRGRQARSELSHRSVELSDAIHRMQDFDIQRAQGGGRW